jgi:hypothetical protein
MDEIRKKSEKLRKEMQTKRKKTFEHSAVLTVILISLFF